MDDLKSVVAVMATLAETLYCDIASRFSVTSRVQAIELAYMRSRIAEEGLSFLTKTLPRYGKAVDTALATGKLLNIIGFKSGDAAIPKFLGWLLVRLFCARTGGVLDNPEPEALKHLRQFVYFFYKLEIPYEKENLEKVFQSFEDVDNELVAYANACYTDPIVPVARALVARVTGAVDPYRITPKHGPGAVATGEKAHQKAHFKRVYRKLEEHYPFTEWMCFSLSHVADTVGQIQNLSVEDESVSKTIPVNKDSRGPRIISAEPLEIQWIQQGLGAALQRSIERCSITRGHVNFTDQTVNQRLALLGSLGHPWVTLDMKEASDRVSSDLVKSLFADHPELLSCMFACRSGVTELPNGKKVTLNKFASMGSRLCFPVEALVFYALIVGSLVVHKKYSMRQAAKRVYVYGDDIVMRVEDYDVALQCLPSVGLKFNVDKCCTHGFFRESCGVDAFLGVNVTPVRLRTVWSHHQTAAVLESYVALRNAAAGRGYSQLAEAVERLVQSKYGNIPYTDNYTQAPNGAYVVGCEAIAYASDILPARIQNQKFRRRTEVRDLRLPNYGEYQVHSWVSLPERKVAREDNWSGLLRRYITGNGRSGAVYALPRSNRLKRGWVSVE